MAFIIAGSENTVQTLFIKASPDTSNTTTLYVGPQTTEAEGMDLFVVGPTPNQMSLFIKQANQPASGQITAYIGGSKSEAFASDEYQGYAPLSVRGFTGDYSNLEVDLFVSGPGIESLNDNTSLFVDGGPRTFSSGVLTLRTFGEASLLDPDSAQAAASLYIKNRQLDNSNMDLHIESDFNAGQTADLFIKSAATSGNITLFTDGQTSSNENIPLFINTPFDTTGIQLFLVGYNQN